MQLNITMNAETNLTLMRVENGWVIRTEGALTGYCTPLRVARTPEELAGLVLQWAEIQQAAAGLVP